jgi:hypothetical protein
MYPLCWSPLEAGLELDAGLHPWSPLEVGLELDAGSHPWRLLVVLLHPAETSVEDGYHLGGVDNLDVLVSQLRNEDWEPQERRARRVRLEVAVFLEATETLWALQRLVASEWPEEAVAVFLEATETLRALQRLVASEWPEEAAATEILVED